MESGLSSGEVKKRQAIYGKNIVATKHTHTVWGLFISQFTTIINAILYLAAIFSIVIHRTIDGVFLLAIIIINACFGFIQEYRAQKSLEKLQQYTAPTARVLREGKETQILAEDLVPDDIVILSEGDRIPADGVLKEATHLEIDESLLTGESLAVIKKSTDEIYLGTLVLKGQGIIRISKTGMQTRFGQIAQTLSTIQSDKAPLQKNLDQLGKLLSFMALMIALLIIPIGIYHKQALVPLVLVSISIGIAAIPEGLPAVVTIAFAVGAHRMAKQGAIVRKMAAIETLGAIQTILVDKTGTITQNHMRVKKFWTKDTKTLQMLLEACILGNTASLIEKGSGKQYEVLGDRTDGALLMWAKEQNMPLTIDKEHVIDEYVFDPEMKTITTVWQHQGEKYVFVRGAPEVILEKSAGTAEEKATIAKHFADFANEGLRIIGFAMKKEHHTGHTTRKHLEQGLTFLGFTGIFDPPRAEVKNAVAESRRAGIHVIMVTGDNELTALSLAKDIGLIEQDEDVVTGEELSKMSDEELGSIIAKTSIFARTQPEEKLRLVSVLKQQGMVVGVTGDGVNDALALKKADVGIAMGEGGTDVAKEAADIILTDDNFATLIKAIEEGRTIYKNISNAVLYLVSGNLAEISLVFFANLFQLPFPLIPTQILWINLITDSLPAIALATGSKDISVLAKKPRDPHKSLLNERRILFIFILGFGMAICLITIFSILLVTNSQEVARTVTFNLLIYFHLLIVLVIGRQSFRKGNLFLIFTILIIVAMQISINIIPIFQQIFQLAH